MARVYLSKIFGTIMGIQNAEMQKMPMQIVRTLVRTAHCMTCYLAY